MIELNPTFRSITIAIGSNKGQEPETAYDKKIHVETILCDVKAAAVCQRQGYLAGANSQLGEKGK